MSKFENRSFTANTTQSSGNSNSKQVDWAGLNNHVSTAVQEATGCEEGTPSVAVGIISGLVDYGYHQDPERVEPMDEGDAGTKEWKQRQVDNGKASIDDEGNFHYQAPARQEVGFYIDFPNITVDKGQFFENSNPAPYRVLLGGVFNKEPAQKTKVEGYPNKANVWVFGDRSRATKLAKAAKLKDLKDGFAQSRLLELIGKPVAFNLEVFINDAGYLQEKITNPSPVMAGVPVPELSEDLLFYVGMQDKDNDDTSLKFLTKAVKDYIKVADNYEGSVLQGQLEALEASDSPNTETPKQSVPEKKEPVKQAPSEPEIDEFEDVPF